MMVGTQNLIDKWWKISWRIDEKYNTSTKCKPHFLKPNTKHKEWIENT